MPGELPPALRLLQAVCWPGHGLLLHRGRVVLESGESTVVKRAARALAGVTPRDTVTLPLGEVLVVCARRQGDHVLAVVMASSIEPTAVHARLERAIAAFARSPTTPFSPASGGGSMGGSSGAPAELSVARARPRPS